MCILTLPPGHHRNLSLHSEFKGFIREEEERALGRRWCPLRVEVPFKCRMIAIAKWTEPNTSIRRKVMSMKKLAVGLALGLVMAVAIRSAQAEDIPFAGHLSGGSIPTEIDTNGDGLKASFGLGGVISRPEETVARGMFQIVVEFLPALSENVTCPAGNLEFPLLQGHGILRSGHTGNLVFLEYTSGTSCVDPTTDTSSFSGEGFIAGGTGRFEGATGSFAVDSTGTTLVSDPAGHEFGSQTGEITGTVITVGDGEDEGLGQEPLE
jgi:hypothetical protein